MSTEEPSSRKAKKAQRDAERHKKGKKRKHAETEEAEAQPAEPTKAEDIDQEATASTKKSKKRKSEDVEDGGVPLPVSETAPSEATKRPKKKRKKTPTEGGAEPSKPTKSRFILFIGNLSFKTTDDTLRAHFKKLEPFTLRHLTDPKTKKSKGCAFIEFENYDRLKTCIKLYHHSIFDPTKKDLGGDPEVQVDDGKKKLGKDARRINVELTAGGGGKTDARKEKIKAKNVRLEEQRKRRAELERKERAKKEKEGGGKAKDKLASVKEEQQADAGAEEGNASHGIHPSRLARMNV